MNLYRHKMHGVLTIAVIGYLLTACSASTSTETSSGQLPLVRWVSTVPIEAGIGLTGSLIVDTTGCVQLQDAGNGGTFQVIWPTGTYAELRDRQVSLFSESTKLLMTEGLVYHLDGVELPADKFERQECLTDSVIWAVRPADRLTTAPSS